MNDWVLCVAALTIVSVHRVADLFGMIRHQCLHCYISDHGYQSGDWVTSRVAGCGWPKSPLFSTQHYPCSYIS